MSISNLLFNKQFKRVISSKNKHVFFAIITIGENFVTIPKKMFFTKINQLNPKER
jgi:hypothetical protein